MDGKLRWLYSIDDNQKSSEIHIFLPDKSSSSCYDVFYLFIFSHSEDIWQKLIRIDKLY